MVRDGEEPGGGVVDKAHERLYKPWEVGREARLAWWSVTACLNVSSLLVPYYYSIVRLVCPKPHVPQCSLCLYG